MYSLKIKFFISISLAILCIHSSLAQKEPIAQITKNLVSTVITMNWNNLKWENEQQAITEFDSKGNPVKILELVWLKDSYKNQYMTTLIHDLKKNEVMELKKKWEENVWKDNCKIITVYDKNKNKIKELAFYWNGEYWLRRWEYKFLYDAQGNLTEKINLEWSGSEEEFYLLNTGDTMDLQINYSRSRKAMTYDSIGRKISETRYHWDNQAWEEEKLYTYTYDSLGNRTSELEQRMEEGEWETIRKKIYTYDGKGNITEELIKVWIRIFDQRNRDPNFTGMEMSDVIEERPGPYWQDEERILYLYNDKGILIKEIHQKPDGKVWINAWQMEETVDASGNFKSTLFQDWENSSWINRTKIDFITKRRK